MKGSVLVLVGITDSVFSEILRLAKIAAECGMAEFVLTGGHGGVNGGANMFPKLYVDLYNAARNRDVDKIITLQQKVMQISTTIYSIGSFGSSYLKGLKCALSVLGICSDFMAEPFHRFNEPERKKIEEAITTLHLQ